MAAPTGLRFLVATSDLRSTRTTPAPDATLALPPGGVRLRIAHFALTANNITYAAFGEAMKYWQFFPTGEPGWGCIPVWGFAEVVESRSEHARVGERLYGYLPMATHLVVQPDAADAQGFSDASPHRRALSPVYNRLLRCATDPLYHPDQEAQNALLRPLFVTSFLIDDFLAEHEHFGASRVLLSSASSKTAYATAFCLAQRRGSEQAVQVVGLTSPRNLEFVRSLGCYDEVVAYDALPAVEPQAPAVYVDFSGDAALRRAVHTHLADLRFSSAVGGTHWEQLGGGAGLPGPRPELFFAPNQVRRRSAPPPDGWGAEGFQLRVAQSWAAFLKPVMRGNPPWLKVVHGEGPAAVAAAYRTLLDGAVDPREGHLLSL